MNRGEWARIVHEVSLEEASLAAAAESAEAAGRIIREAAAALPFEASPADFQRLFAALVERAPRQ